MFKPKSDKLFSLYFMKVWICQNLFCLMLIVFFNQLVVGQIHTALGEKASSINADRAVNLEKQAETGLFQWNKQSIEFAQKTYLEAFAIWNKLGELKKSSVSLRKAAKAAKILSKNNVAENLYLQSLAVSKVSKAIDEQINSLCDLSLFYLEEGNLSKARSIFFKATELTEINGIKFKSALFWFTSAEFEYAKRNIKKSIEFYIKAIESISSSDSLYDKANYLRFLGDAYLFEENYNQAIFSLQESLEISSLIGDKRGQALSQVVLAHTSSKLNEKQVALNYYNQAKNLFPNDIDFVEKARLMNALGNIYKDFGELKSSIDYRMKALQLFDNANYAYGKVATLSSLGMLYISIGEFEKAKSYLLESEFLAKKLDDEYYLAIIHEELGNLNFSEGDYNSAKNYYYKSLKHFLKYDSKREIAFIYEKLGQINNFQNKNNNSKIFFQRSIELNRIIQNKFGESENLYHLAKLDLIENKPDESLNNIKESINLTENLYTEVTNTNLKRTYFSNVFDRYELYINLLMKMHKQLPNENFAIQALQAAEKSRSRSLLETLRLSKANFTKDADPELVQKEEEIRSLLNLKTDKLTELLSSNADKSETDKLDNEINSLQNELEDIKGKLKANSPVYSAIKNPAPFDVAEFQQNVLDDETVLIEFLLGEKESYLWLVGKTEVSHVVLPPQNVLENRIEAIRQTFDSRQMLPGEDVETYQKRAADAESVFSRETKLLSNELFGQIAEKIANKRLIIVPDGKLALLPISALPFPDSDESFAVRNEIVYQPSASFLNILPKLQNPKHQPNKDLLVFADPVFNDSDSRLTGKAAKDSFFSSILNLRDFRLTDANGNIPRLFATQKEADSIAEAVGKSNTEIVSGFAANREKALSDDVSDYRILHFATHGLIDLERPEISSIVLSQFDETGQKREGFLRLQDIYALDLSSDLVVLSACQSGVGKEVKGEGMMSLNNAFLQAGAKSVLSSAWKVDDDATAEFMKRFYTNLINEKLTPAESLRRTQIEMARETQFKSPFYWAAFTVQGEYRQPISISHGYFYPILFGFLGLMAIGFLWCFKFSKFYSTVKK